MDNEWVEAIRVKTFFYMTQALIDELGEEKEKQVIKNTAYKMSKINGEKSVHFVIRTQEITIDSNDTIYSIVWLIDTVKR